MHCVRVAICLIVSFAAAAAQNFPLSVPQAGPAPGDRAYLRAAASDEQFLVVWSDTREGLTLFDTSRVFAARVTRDGRVLDPHGIAVGNSSIDDILWEPVQAVASDGRDFLVATREQRALQLTKVTSDGNVTRLPALSGTPIDNARLTWIGDAYLLTYSGSAALLDRNGNVLVNPFPLVIGEVEELVATSISDGLVQLAWSDHADNRVHVAMTSYSALRTGEARFRSTPGPLAASVPTRLEIASNGERSLVTWSTAGYHARFLDASGSALQSVMNFDWAWYLAPALPMWDGTAFLVAHSPKATGGGDVTLRAIENDGATREITDATRPAARDYYDQLAIATSAGRTLFARIANISGTEEVFVDVLDQSHQPVNAQPILLTTSFSAREFGTAVWRGDHYLAAWVEYAPQAKIMTARLSRSGQRLDGAGRLVQLAPESRHQAEVALATDGHDALLLHNPGDGLQASIIDAEGVARPSVSLGQGWGGSVTYNGTEYGVCTTTEILRISRSGEILQRAPLTGHDCSIAWTGNEYVVTYAYRYYLGVSEANANVRTFSRSLDPIGTPILLGGAKPYTYRSRGLGTSVIDDRVLSVWIDAVGNLRGARIQSGVNLDAPNGFVLGQATHVGDVFVENGVWVVTSGPYAWTVLRNGTITPREIRYPFIAETSDMKYVTGGPSPLLVFDQAADELVPQLWGRFLGATGVRGRSVRH